jgi:hypothetical protein
MPLKPTTWLLVAQATALLSGYILRAPDLSATAERQDSIRSQEKQTQLDQQEAMHRAQRCVVLMTELPITDGSAAYFSSIKNGQIIIDKKRPFPSNTTVCDAYGNTGIVATDNEGNPIVSDIKQIPPEQMEKILIERNAMPRIQGLRKFAKSN